MARKSYEQVVTKIVKDFAQAHPQVLKSFAEFDGEIDNMVTKGEEFPALIVSFRSWQVGLPTNIVTLDVLCLDVIQKDRGNVLHVVSDTALILNDLFLFMSDGDDWDFDTSLVGQIEPINNSRLDYLGGNKMTLDIEVESYSVCEVPIGDIIVPPITCEPVVVSNSDDSYVQTIQSGGTLELPDTEFNVFFNSVLQATFLIPTLN